jgi:hypothetical protein
MTDLRHFEAVLEMAHRHVREGEERLARQAAIVAKMEAAGRAKQAALGRSVLESMRTALELQRGHLRDIEARATRHRRAVID